MDKVKTAIIVAADGKGTLPIFGIPAIRRLVLLALQMGFGTIEIIGDVDPFRSVLSDLLPEKAFHPVGDPEGFGEVVDQLDLSKTEPVLVLKANHVIDQMLFRRLEEIVTGPDLYSLETPGTGNADPIYVSMPAHLVPLLHALGSPKASKLKVPEPVRHVERASGLPCTLEKGEDQARLSEAKLMASLSLQTEADDGFLARHFDRRVSRFFSKRLARTGVDPNPITLAGVGIGLTGAFLLSRPGYWLPLVGSLLFLFCVVVDGVDGEVARLRLRETPFGHYLDVVTDNIVHVAVFVGIAFGLYHDTGERRYLYSLGFLLAGFGLCAVAVYECILKRTPEELRGSPSVRLLALLTNRDFSYVIVVFALIHRLHWFFMGATLGTYIFAGTLWTMNFYEKRRLRMKLHS